MCSVNRFKRTFFYLIVQYSIDKEFLLEYNFSIPKTIKEAFSMLNACAELFTNKLQAQNLNFRSGTDKDGDSVVEFPYQGKIAKMFFCGPEGGYFSIYVVYERVPEEKLADVIFLCNELNAQYKWITFYVDKDGDVVLHDDAILSVDSAADEAFELLIRMLKIGDEVKPTIMKAIYA